MKVFVSLNGVVARRPLIAFTIIVAFIYWPTINRVQAVTGDLDPTFGNAGTVITPFDGGGGAVDVVIQKDGKIVAVGGANSDFALARYNSDGSLDPTFGTEGKVTTDFFGGLDHAFAALLQEDGRVIAIGTAFKVDHYVFALARYNVDGSLDSTFGSGGKIGAELFDGRDAEQAYDAALQKDGKVIVVGNSLSNGSGGLTLARFNIDGTIDTSFGSNGKVTTTLASHSYAVALQQDGRIVVGGFFFRIAPTIDFSVARFNSDGSLDTSFGSGGIVATDFYGRDDFLYDLAVQEDGKIVGAGIAFTDVGIYHFSVTRYNGDGSLDTSFGTGGKATTAIGSYSAAYAVAIQSNGKIIMGGVATPGFAFVRYSKDGSLDLTFGSGGISTGTMDDRIGAVLALAIQKDGKIVGAGSAGDDFAVVRLNGDGFDACLQDESNGNLLQINSTTGDYQFTNCSGFTVGGAGTLTKKGSTIILQHNASDRRISAKLDTAVSKATASIQMLSQAMTFSITDRNTANNTCACR
jgi:uncharacterized delta-60 repeat protein